MEEAVEAGLSTPLSPLDEDSSADSERNLLAPTQPDREVTEPGMMYTIVCHVDYLSCAFKNWFLNQLSRLYS